MFNGKFVHARDGHHQQQEERLIQSTFENDSWHKTHKIHNYIRHWIQ